MLTPNEAIPPHKPTSRCKCGTLIVELVDAPKRPTKPKIKATGLYICPECRLVYFFPENLR